MNIYIRTEWTIAKNAITNIKYLLNKKKLKKRKKMNVTRANKGYANLLLSFVL